MAISGATTMVALDFGSTLAARDPEAREGACVLAAGGAAVAESAVGSPDSAVRAGMRQLDQGAALTDIEFSRASDTTFSSGGGDVASATPAGRRLVHPHPVHPPWWHGGILRDNQFWGRGAATRCRSSSRVAPCSLHVMAAQLQQTPPPALAGSAGTC
ncbi:uncharacterized protein [Triticum aestivum]|uniref:uncharacterized protein n=1 Tax=Triticum aestivum TaxID=4565 RepID=UPI001D022891|nr:uncharacterized protein LOC123140837 [Triticum aestivum]